MTLSALILRPTRAADRDAIIALVQATRFFRENELGIAIEVLDDALAQGPDGHYRSYTALVNATPVGWLCFGATPCTLGTFDIYWLAVAPAQQGHGVGSRLLSHAEELIRAGGGRLIVIETSGQDRYASTQMFYRKNGYIEAARVPDFYAPGDDKIIYTKVVTATP